jgi:hypothetical protein
MLTKSKIQIIQESIKVANDFKTGLENIMEKYTIEDSIFMYKNGVFEATKGYFVPKSEHNDLLLAIKECNSEYNKYGIRIINNEKFIVGEVNRFLTECDQNSTIFDINSLTDIR